MTYAIILAGGVGSRFWPLSKSLEPKQFLNLCSNKSMLEETIHRIGGLIEKKNIYVASNKIYSRKIKDCIRYFNIPFENILFEPESKNTFAPIAVLTSWIESIDPEAVIVVLPCDHIIRYRRIFLDLLRKAMKAARAGYIVTLGVPPKRPETGYGYIKAGQRLEAGGWRLHQVERFIEKPDLKKAKKLLKDKRHYWNSGIFIFSSTVMLTEIKRFLPQAYRSIEEINKANLDKIWPRLPKISIDYAIMEKSRKMAVLPQDYGWMDLGSWDAIEEISKKDKHANILKGRRSIALDTKESIIWSDNRLVAAIGLNNIIIVDTKDALLVCAKNKSQDVKKIVQILKKKNYKEHI